MLVSHRAAGSNVNQLFLLAAPGSVTRAPDRFPGADQRMVRSIRAEVASSFIRATPAATKRRASIGSISTLARSTLLSDPETRSEASWNEAGTRLLIASVPLDRTAQGGRRDQIGTTLTLLDPLKPDDRRVDCRTARAPAGSISRSRRTTSGWSMIRYISRTETEVWRIEVASGKRERLLPAAKADASGLKRATYFGLAVQSGWLALVPDDDRDAASFSSSPSIGSIRERCATSPRTFRGTSRAWRCRAMGVGWPRCSTSTGAMNFDCSIRRAAKELARPKIPGGQISGLKWHEKRVGELAFTLNSPQSPATILQRRYSRRCCTALDDRGYRRGRPGELSRRRNRALEEF